METQAKTLKDLRLKKDGFYGESLLKARKYFDATSSSVSLCFILCQEQRPSSFSNA